MLYIQEQLYKWYCYITSAQQKVCPISKRFEATSTGSSPSSPVWAVYIISLNDHGRVRCLLAEHGR
jgi:hypothetical protein